jgi:hypothetical protein
MATDSTAICNSSMIKLGVEKIASLAENSRAAILCNEQYDKKRKQLLQSHYWNFAIKRHAFVDSGSTPEYEFAYAYTIPSDYLRMAGTEYSPSPDGSPLYQREGAYILSNYSPFRGKYVYDLTDTTKFTPTFDEALALLIALDLCHTLTQDKGLWDRLQAELKEVLRDTRSFDAQENPSYPLMEDIFINARA